MLIRQIKSIKIEDLEKMDPAPIDQPHDAKTTKPTKEELKTLKKDNKYYLPVLRLNDATEWPQKPNSQKVHLTDKIAEETCLSNCCGHPGVKSACCRMDPDDLEHVLGPVDDKSIKKIIKWFAAKGITMKREDIVIDYEEGRIIGEKLFNGHTIFEKKDSFPIMRFQVEGPRYACKFLNQTTGHCGIYSVRPSPMCLTYYCQYIKSNFHINTKGYKGKTSK
jgi:Fe-S-cluster containining protein